jgi:hypothetical protein
MRKVIVQAWMTLDGVVQAPGAPDEDTTGGFRHGGWSLHYFDLVDELRVMVDPLLVGGGKRLFAEDGALRPLRLLESQVATSGAILATYAPAKG